MCTALPVSAPFRYAHSAYIFLPVTILGARPIRVPELRDDFIDAAFDSLDPTGEAVEVCGEAVRCFVIGC